MLRCTALAVLTFAVLSVSAAVETPWLDPVGAERSGWQSRLVAADRIEFAVDPQQPSALRVLVFAGKRSPSYDAALSRVCRDFAAAGLRPDITALLVPQRDPVAAGRKVLAERYDLALAVGSEALQVAHEHLRGDARPVVALVCKDPFRLGYLDNPSRGGGANLAYTSLNVDPELQLEWLRRIDPELRAVAVLYDQTRDLIVRAEVAPMIHAYRMRGLTVVPVPVDGAQVAKHITPAMEAARSELQVQDPQLAHTVWWISSCTSLFSQVEAINAAAAGAPVISENPALVTASSGTGAHSAAIAIGIDRASNAHIAARYAIAILRDGVDPGSLPLGVPNPPDIAINLQRTRALGMQLPLALLEAANVVYGPDGQLVRGAQH